MSFYALVFYHILGLIIAVGLDTVFGDPRSIPHPVQLIGKLIEHFDVKYNTGSGNSRRKGGLTTALIVLAVTILASLVLIVLGYIIHPILGVIIEGILGFFCIAKKDLRVESMKVSRELKKYSRNKKRGAAAEAKQNIRDARKALSMIVGRDTERLSGKAIMKATIETVAESTSDGVIAPLLYLIIGGPVLGMAYKAVNTMDSMIGYKNEDYIDFGRTAAKLDDILNFVPARLTAYFMIFATSLLEKFREDEDVFDTRNAKLIYKRDAKRSSSPNAGHPESVMAGALGLELLGDAYYGGVLAPKPTIGDPIRQPGIKDIERANDISGYASWTFITAGLLVLTLVFIIATLF